MIFAYFREEREDELETWEGRSVLIKSREGVSEEEEGVGGALRREGCLPGEGVGLKKGCPKFPQSDPRLY